jgi:hypothetical protein
MRRRAVGARSVVAAATGLQRAKTLGRSALKIGAACAMAGSALMLAGTLLHPMHADPNDAVAAFTEYALDRYWIASHLMQLAGVVLMVAALLILTRRAEATTDAAWPRLAAGGAIASLAVATALQAVDGVALKAMVDNWAAAPALEKAMAFQAALAVRQVEIGLASTLSMLFGLTISVCGAALLDDRAYPRWLAVVGILGGVPAVIAAVVMAYTGFSGLAMVFSMSAGSLLIAWMAAVGVCMWRRSAD